MSPKHLQSQEFYHREDILRAIDAVVAEADENGCLNSDTIAYAIEAYQNYKDYLDDIDFLPMNDKVIVKKDGVTIQFPNIDSVADWMTQWMQ
jgi:hypothetical protein